MMTLRVRGPFFLALTCDVGLIKKQRLDLVLPYVYIEAGQMSRDIFIIIIGKWEGDMTACTQQCTQPPQ